MNNFEKYGFDNPSFKGEISKSVNDCFTGYALNSINDIVVPLVWNKKGIALNTLSQEYDLTRKLDDSWMVEDNAFPVLMNKEESEIALARNYNEYVDKEKLGYKRIKNLKVQKV